MLLAGEIGKPHGIGGEVYVVRISDDPRRFEPGSELVHSDGRTLVVEGARAHRDRLLVKFVGVDTRTEAEALRGALFVAGEERRALEEDEFWVDDLVGREVRLPDGKPVGTVARVAPGPAHDHLVIDTPSGERLVPLVKEIVTGVALDEGIVTVDPPAGLLD